jgi:hypothetical protein
MTNPQKGIWSFYNSRHDQSIMGIDPMNNISNNNKNTLCSYIISTLPLNKKGILQQHQARERGQHHQQHQVGERTASSISSWNNDWRIYKSSEVFFIGSIVILKGMQSSSASICISIKLIHHHHHHSHCFKNRQTGTGTSRFDWLEGGPVRTGRKTDPDGRFMTKPAGSIINQPIRFSFSQGRPWMQKFNIFLFF